MSARQATAACLARIQHLNGNLGAYWRVFAASALLEAEAADDRSAKGLSRGALDGLPIAIKDNIDVAGWPTTAGIAAFRTREPEEDAAVVRLLRAQGAVILGKTALDEAAFGGTGRNAAYGDCRHPLRLSHSPGGSSAGSAVAVAAGMAAAAVGTDTLGSVRLPAAFCGVVGFKPSPGALPMQGVTPLSQTLDSLGLITRTAADMARLWSALHGSSAPPTRSLSGRHVGVVTIAAQPESQAALMRAAAALTTLGAQVSPAGLAGYDPAAARKNAIRVMQSEAASHFAAPLATYPQGFSAELRAHLAAGAARSADSLGAAREGLALAANVLRDALADTPVLLAPTTLREAFAGTTTMNAWEGDATALANIAGLPAVTIPAGVGETGLPLGVQLIAARGADADLLQIAITLEAALAVAPVLA